MTTTKLFAILAALSAVLATTAAEARGGGGGGGGRGFSGGHGSSFHGGFRHNYRSVVVYPTYSECRWFRTSYGLVKRCF